MPNHRHFRVTPHSITKKTISEVHVFQGSADTLVRRGGITIQRSIAYTLSNISVKNSPTSVDMG